MTTDNDAPAAGLVERIMQKIEGVMIDAKVDYPAGREVGPRVSYDEDAIRNYISAALQAPQEAGVAFRQIVEKAFNDPIEIWPTGWREKYPALTEPDTGTVHRRINDALSALSQPVATPAPRPQLGTIPNYPEYDNARIK